MTASAEHRRRALAVLEAHWEAERGHSYPHTSRYPHQWLWDSCFTAICWAALGDPRAVSELATALSDQLPDGFVPHMRYAGPTIDRGPLAHVSSFTQPPVHAHAAAFMARHGLAPGEALTARIAKALEFLLGQRRWSDGLVFIVHPWESGADDSPRWDAWMAADWEPLRWDYRRWTDFDLDLVGRTRFNQHGAAVAGTSFQVAPAAFNALTAHAATELAALGGDQAWLDRAEQLAAAIDERLWDEGEGLWSDAAIVGGGASVRVPTLDGVLPALVTADPARARRALDQLLDPDRFLAPYGLAYVARDHPKYQPDAYWRGTAWMQMNYLARLAALRWGRADVADRIVEMSRRAVDAAELAEHWNPETGQGYGATPLTWSALIVALDAGA
jgi:Mannosylglycerate hydrolase MGH1-like glycoside hydrolase domain